MSNGSPVPAEFRIDGREVRRSFGRAARDYDAAAVLQAEVRNELLGRLDLVRLVPQVVLDLGAGTGRATIELKRRYRASQVVAVDLAEGMLREAARSQTLLRRFRRVCADAAMLPLRDASVDLVLSNLMLQWCDDPDRVFAECRRVLRPNGLLAFSTFGPDTLVELRRAWSVADGRTHVNRFIDMHDLGDALVRSGFAEPVLERRALHAHLCRSARPDARPESDRRAQRQRRPATRAHRQGHARPHARGLRRLPARGAAASELRGRVRPRVGARRAAQGSRRCGRGVGAVEPDRAPVTAFLTPGTVPDRVCRLDYYSEHFYRNRYRIEVTVNQY